MGIYDTICFRKLFSSCHPCSYGIVEHHLYFYFRVKEVATIGIALSRRAMISLLASTLVAGCMPQPQPQSGQNQPVAAATPSGTLTAVVSTPTAPAELAGTPGTRIIAFDTALLNRIVAAVDPKRAFETITTLSADTYAGREAGQPGATLAGKYVVDRYQTLQLQPWTKIGLTGFEQKFPLPGGGETANITGIIRGSTTPESYVLVAANYDGFGRDKSGAVLPGADESLSGLATLLETARVVQSLTIQPKETLVFVAFSGTKAGMLGVQTLGRKLQETNLVAQAAMLNIMETGANGGDFADIWDESLRDNEVIVDRITKAARFLGIKIRRNGHDSGSDANIFATSYKIPAVALSWASSAGNGSTYHPYLHTPADKPDAIDQAAFGNALKLAVLTAWILANDS